MDASDDQIGVVKSKSDKPITLYIRKQTGPQNRYTVTEKGLFKTVETF